MTEIPDKLFFKIGEVSDITQLEPHILRYWEMEFQKLHPRKNEAGQRLYVKRDVELILTIKKLLYKEGYTILGAKKKLSEKRKDSIKALKEMREDLKTVLSILSH